MKPGKLRDGFSGVSVMPLKHPISPKREQSVKKGFTDKTVPYQALDL